MIYKNIKLANADADSNLATHFAKEMTKTHNKPYTIKDSIDGAQTRVVFSPHFVEMFREAFSTQDMTKMSKIEKRTFWDYMMYMNAKISIDLPDYDNAPSDEARKALERDYNAAVEMAYNSNSEWSTPILVVEAISEYSASEMWDTGSDSEYMYTHTWEE